MHYAARRMTSCTQKQVAEFVSSKMPENDSMPHTTAVGKLLGVIREHVRHHSEGAVFQDSGEAEAVPGLAQPLRHGLR